MDMPSEEDIRKGRAEGKEVIDELEWRRRVEDKLNQLTIPIFLVLGVLFTIGLWWYKR